MRASLVHPQPGGRLSPSRALLPQFRALAAAQLDIKRSTDKEELQSAAWLRAEAYFEEKSVGRFKASFVKQFAGQHLYSLLRQTQGQDPLCITLVAAEAGASAAATGPTGAGGCVGTLDVRLLDAARSVGARWPDGVPPEQSAAAAYVSNVVVTPARRGRGFGRQLVAAAAEAAAEAWSVQRLYCHVETDNAAALQLYTRSGYSQLGEELPPADDGQGRRLLLCRSLEEGGGSSGGDAPAAAINAPAAAIDAPAAASDAPAAET